jgi:hypothetical protein
VPDRVGQVFSDGPDRHEILQLAPPKLQEGAAGDPRLIRRARDNTRGMLESLLRSLGFERFEIRFATEPGT